MRKLLLALAVLAATAQAAEAGFRDRLRARRGAGCVPTCAAASTLGGVPVIGCAQGRCPVR